MRKRCIRKIWAKVNPIAHAIEGAAITPQRQLDRLRVRELAAIDAFTRGAASLADWRDLTNMLNMCETMAREGIGPEAQETRQRVPRRPPLQSPGQLLGRAECAVDWPAHPSSADAASQRQRPAI